mmetsp:Transcript_10117/g.18221  ORF Transcript_10117/g.18221 Transcript_10117/m.18221 type:complete len:192 (-) Transcript_10117:454-1029(-)
MLSCLGLDAEEPSVVLLIGIDSAGSSSIMHFWSTGSAPSQKPHSTLGVDKATVKVPREFRREGKPRSVQLFNVGGTEKTRGLWSTYLPLAVSLVYVIDSADRSRLLESRDELFKLTFGGDDSNIRSSAKMKNIPLLVLANKRDVSDSASKEELTSNFELSLLPFRAAELFETSALTGMGLQEALKWLFMKI